MIQLSRLVEGSQDLRAPRLEGHEYTLIQSVRPTREVKPVSARWVLLRGLRVRQTCVYCTPYLPCLKNLESKKVRIWGTRRRHHRFHWHDFSTLFPRWHFSPIGTIFPDGTSFPTRNFPPIGTFLPLARFSLLARLSPLSRFSPLSQ